MSRGLYAHYGVEHFYGLVLELSGDKPMEISSAKVRLSPREVFAHGGTVEHVYRPSAEEFDGLLARADELLGLPGYNVIGRNCEHVARYVATGKWTSTQVVTFGWVAFIFFLSRMDWGDSGNKASRFSRGQRADRQ